MAGLESDKVEKMLLRKMCKSRLSSRQDHGLKSGMDKGPQARPEPEGNGSSDLEEVNATGSFPRMR